jgi:hypothetical protein
MNKTKKATLFQKLIKLANHLDSKGLAKEADYLDNVILKMSSKEAEYKKYIAEKISKIIGKISGREVDIGNPNASVTFDGEFAQNIYNEFMGQKSFGKEEDLTGDIKELDPAIKEVEFSGNTMTIEIATDIVEDKLISYNVEIKAVFEDVSEGKAGYATLQITTSKLQ